MPIPHRVVALEGVGERLDDDLHEGVGCAASCARAMMRAATSGRARAAALSSRRVIHAGGGLVGSWDMGGLSWDARGGCIPAVGYGRGGVKPHGGRRRRGGTQRRWGIISCMCPYTISCVQKLLRRWRGFPPYPPMRHLGGLTPFVTGAEGQCLTKSMAYTNIVAKSFHETVAGMD